MMINSSVRETISFDSIYLIDAISVTEKIRQLNGALADAGLTNLMQNLDWQEITK